MKIYKVQESEPRERIPRKRSSSERKLDRVLIRKRRLLQEKAML